MDERALLIDVTRCDGCGRCVAACTDAYGAPARTWIERRDDVYVRGLCRHCREPMCVEACAAGALRRGERGAVELDEKRCVGCRDCMLACPFGAIRFPWAERAGGSVRKCDLCDARVGPAGVPLCAAACATGATFAGTRAAVLAEARRRLDVRPAAYDPRVHGEIEGASVVLLLPPDVEALGLPEIPAGTPLPRVAWEALRRNPGVAAGGAALCLALWWITRRRAEVQACRDAAAAAAHARSRAAKSLGKENDHASARTLGT